MTKERVQIFLSSRAIVLQKKLCAKHGWTASQFYNRLFSFYTRVHDYADNFDLQESTEGDRFYFRDPDTGDVEAWEQVDQPFLTLVEMIHDGLTPDDGFADEESEVELEY